MLQFLSNWKTHRRCSSFPNVIMPRVAKAQSKLPPLDTEMAAITPPGVTVIRPPSTIESTLTDKKPCLEEETSDWPVTLVMHKSWRSLPSLIDIEKEKHNGSEKLMQPKSAPVMRRPCTLPSSPAIHPVRTSSPNVKEHKTISASVLKIDYKQLQKDTSMTKSILKNTNKNNKSSTNEVIVLKEVCKSQPIVIKNKAQRHSDLNRSVTSSITSNGSSDILENKSSHHKRTHEISNSIYEETDSSYVDTSSLKRFHRRVRLKSSSVRCGIKINRRKSFMESGGNSVQPMSTGFFPQPTQGQSLASFLSSGQFAGAKAELDRENAHFAISEAMIAAIEQVGLI